MKGNDDFGIDRWMDGWMKTYVDPPGCFSYNRIQNVIRFFRFDVTTSEWMRDLAEFYKNGGERRVTVPVVDRPSSS
jgi:Ca2+-binding EF-hand superfamily protein